MAEKDIENKEKSQSWAQKINENRSTYLTLAIVILCVFLISFWYINNLRVKSEKAWALVGAVSAAMSHAQVSDMNLKIEDLNIDAHKLVRQKLGSIESIPEFFREKATNLDDVFVRKLPEDLRRTVLVKHYKVALEEQIKEANNTSAAPFLYYWLANICFQENNAKEASQWYQKIINKYPNHFLRAEAERDMIVANKDADWLETQTKSTTENLEDFESKSSVEVLTSKGSFSIELFSKNKKATDNISNLIKASFYTGLSFYQNSPEQIKSGCSLGSGFSKVGQTKTEYQDVEVQRGLVVLENIDGVVGQTASKFSIIKKYPYSNGLQRCTILGIISEEDMSVVDSLTNADVILSVSSKQITN